VKLLNPSKGQETYGLCNFRNEIIDGCKLLFSRSVRSASAAFLVFDMDDLNKKMYTKN